MADKQDVFHARMDAMGRCSDCGCEFGAGDSRRGAERWQGSIKLTRCRACTRKMLANAEVQLYPKFPPSAKGKGGFRVG